MEPIATEEMVLAVADALTAEGVQPSSRRVRERIGGGSLATIQRHLRAWRGAGDAGHNPQPADATPPAPSQAAAADWAPDLADVAARLDLLAKAVVAMGRNLDQAGAPDLSGALDALDARLSVIAAVQREEVAQLAQRFDAPASPPSPRVDPLDALGAQIAALAAAVTVELDALRLAAEDRSAVAAEPGEEIRGALEALAAAQHADGERLAARLDALEAAQAETAAGAASREARIIAAIAASAPAPASEDAAQGAALAARLEAMETTIAAASAAVAAAARSETARGVEVAERLRALTEAQHAATGRLDQRADAMETAIAAATSAARDEIARGAEIAGVLETLAGAAAAQRGETERLAARLGAVEAALAAAPTASPADSRADRMGDLAAALAPVVDRLEQIARLVADFAAQPPLAARPVSDPAQRVALDGVGRSVEAVDGRLAAVEDVVRQIYRHAIAVDDRLAGSLIATLTPEAAAELNAGPAPAGDGLAPPEMLRLLAAAMTPLAEEVRRLSAERRRLIANGPESP